jgi:hypothetical protein
VVTRSDVEVVLPITLGQFVKVAGMAATGGDAKMMVTTGMVRPTGRWNADAARNWPSEMS